MTTINTTSPTLALTPGAEITSDAAPVSNSTDSIMISFTCAYKLLLQISPREPLSPTSKATLKNEKALNKVLLKEAKGEEKKLKAAIKDGSKATKSEQKAAKQANKAKKILDKAMTKEYSKSKQPLLLS